MVPLFSVNPSISLEPPALEKNSAGRRLSNLAISFLILPKDQQKDLELLYTFCRHVDDLADDEGVEPLRRISKLDAWRLAFEGALPLPPDIEEMKGRRNLDSRLFLEIIEGMKMDLEEVRYASFEALKGYCWKVASAVGLLCMQIFGGHTPAHRRYAENLGLALQLTNILRDVAEDAARNRVYFPEEDLAKFGLSREDILALKPSVGFTSLMAYEAERAEAFYQKALAELSTGERSKLPAAEIMREIYGDILCQMRRDGFRVFSKRYRVSRPRKLWIVARIWLKAKFSPC